jgi:hypothetical protein
MTNASETLQSAVVAALTAHPVLNDVLTGVYDGAPPRAAYPYLVIGDGIATDWSTKTATGREVQLMLTIWDDGETPARLQALMAATEHAVAALPRDIAGWRIASLVFLRARVVRDPAGPWAGLVDHRVRMLGS